MHFRSKVQINIAQGVYAVSNVKIGSDDGKGENQKKKGHSLAYTFVDLC